MEKMKLKEFNMKMLKGEIGEDDEIEVLDADTEVVDHPDFHKFYIQNSKSGMTTGSESYQKAIKGTEPIE